MYRATLNLKIVIALKCLEVVSAIWLMELTLLVKVGGLIRGDNTLPVLCNSMLCMKWILNEIYTLYFTSYVQVIYFKMAYNIL